MISATPRVSLWVHGAQNRRPSQCASLSLPKQAEEIPAGTGRVTGVNADWVDNEEVMITAISDSFGAFGWLGVVVVGGGVPGLFRLYESLFDLRKPGRFSAWRLCLHSLGANMGHDADSDPYTAHFDRVFVRCGRVVSMIP